MPRVNEYLVVVAEGGRALVRCRLCGHTACPVTENYKDHVLVARYPVTRAGPHANPQRVNLDHFELREFYCPGCLVLLETEVARPGEPSVWDAQLLLEAQG